MCTFSNAILLTLGTLTLTHSRTHTHAHTHTMAPTLPDPAHCLWWGHAHALHNCLKLLTEFRYEDIINTKYFPETTLLRGMACIPTKCKILPKKCEKMWKHVRALPYTLPARQSMNRRISESSDQCISQSWLVSSVFCMFRTHILRYQGWVQKSVYPLGHVLFSIILKLWSRGVVLFIIVVLGMQTLALHYNVYK